MTLSEFIEKYGQTAELNAEAELKLCEALGIEYIKPKPKSVWDLKGGDLYWRLNPDGEPLEFPWDGDGYDDGDERDQGHIFLTKKEAEAEAKRRAVETLLLKYGGRREWRPDGRNDLIEFNGKSLLVDSELCPYAGGIYFDDMAEAVTAIDKIGEERIKQALFREMEE